MEIEYESEGFKRGASVSNGSGSLTTSWSEVLWAAVTVGRPNVGYVFAHGSSSVYEAVFRWSLIRMAIDQAPAGSRFRRTSAARALDPSEKGAVNYFLGLTMAKLFAAKLLDAPWLLHLDVFRPLLDAVLKGRSRPDLVGQTRGGKWLGLESKGRVSKPSADTKREAKNQAKRVKSLNGAPPAFCIGAVTYFAKETLCFHWTDPEPDPRGRESFSVEVRDEDWRRYYAPALGVLRERAPTRPSLLDQHVLVPVEGADIAIGIHPLVLRHLLDEEWGAAREAADSIASDSPKHIHYQADGIAVVAGASWSRPFRPEAAW